MQNDRHTHTHRDRKAILKQFLSYLILPPPQREKECSGACMLQVSYSEKPERTYAQKEKYEKSKKNNEKIEEREIGTSNEKKTKKICVVNRKSKIDFFSRLIKSILLCYSVLFVIEF